MCNFSGRYAGAKCVTTWFFILSISIITIVLLALSIKDVAQDEWALNYGAVSRHVRGNVMGPGRQTVQPDSELITYKNTFVSWDLDVDCWTLDGLDISLEIAIQTRYISEEIEEILFEFGTESDFKPYVENVLKKLMRETCSNYTSFDYYNQRGNIQTDMLTRIETQLPRLGTHLTTGGFLQLKNIALPVSFNQAILDKRSAEQDIQVAVNQRAQQLIIANTGLSQAMNNGTVLINNANLQASAIQFDAEQQALAIASKYQQRLVVYQIAMSNLGLNASSFIKDVLMNQLLNDARGSTTVFL
jgi:hypothetical protein